ncbi:MAG: hypothetical protein AABM42_02115 [Actinomycetota bacterium]
MQRKEQIDRAIEAGLIEGLEPPEIHRRLLDQGYKRGRSSFYRAVQRVKERMTSGEPAGDERTWEPPESAFKLIGPPRPGEGLIDYLVRESEHPDFVLHPTADGNPCTCGDPVCVEHGGLYAKRPLADSRLDQ